VAQSHIGFGHDRGSVFTLGFGPLGGLHGLALGVIPTTDPCDAVIPTHLAVTRVAIGLQNALKVVEQTHRHFALPL